MRCGLMATDPGEVLGRPPDCHYDTDKGGTVTSSAVWHCGKCVLAMKTWCLKPQAEKSISEIQLFNQEEEE